MSYPHLSQLHEIRSQRSTAAREALRILHQSLEIPPLGSGHGELISRLAVELRVLTRTEKPKLRDREEKDELKELAGEQFSPRLEEDRERYEMAQREEDREAIPWKEAFEGRGRGANKGTRILIAGPGGGKTFTTRYGCAQKLGEMREQLEARQILAQDLDVPLWVTARSLLRLSNLDRGSFAAALVQAVADSLHVGHSGQEQGVTPSFPPREAAWLEERIRHGRYTLVVDGLDELGESDGGTFARAASALEGSKVLFTCRVAQWATRLGFLPETLRARVLELELAPLNKKEQTLFMTRFFAKTEGAGATASSLQVKRLEEMLRRNLWLCHACTSPLLLAFACLLSQEGSLQETSSRGELYDGILRKILSGQWRGVAPVWRPLGPLGLKERVGYKVIRGILREVGWRLFERAPNGRTFRDDDWDKALEHCDRQSLEGINGNLLLEGLDQVGLIFAAGGQEWSFAHRSILEFLAGCGLAQRKPKKREQRFQEHIGFRDGEFVGYDPAWIEVFGFMVDKVAGLEKAPLDRLFELIDQVEAAQKDDLFGSLFDLKAKLAGLAHLLPAIRAENVVRGFSEGWTRATGSFGRAGLKHWQQYLTSLSFQRELAGPALAFLRAAWAGEEDESVRRALARALGGSGEAASLAFLREAWAGERDAQVRLELARALGQSGEEAALAFLREAWAGERDAWVRLEMALALGQSGEAEALAFPFLREAWAGEEDGMVRTAMAAALGQSGEEAALAFLREAWAGEEDARVRRALALALGQSGEAAALAFLREAWAGEEDGGVRRALAFAFGQSGEAEALAFLREAWAGGRDAWVRTAMALALGQSGEAEALAAFLEAWAGEGDARVRRALDLALGQSGEAEALAFLREAWAGEENADVRDAMAAALGQSGEAEALAFLREAWAGARDAWVRRVLALALGQSGEAEALAFLREAWAGEEDADVRDAMALALGQSGEAEALAFLREAWAGEEDGGVRDAMARALGQSGEAAALAFLREAWAGARAWGVRAALARALGQNGKAEDVGKLKEFLDQENNAYVQLMIFDSLSRLAQRFKRKVSV